MNSKISVIIPAYNEEKAMAKVLDDVAAVMQEQRYDFEIIVVDDCSTDKTAEIVKSKGVKLIKHEVNKGVGASRKTGILDCFGDIVVMLDADGTYPASSIPELLKYLPEYDQVIGARKKESGTLRILRQPVKWVMFSLASFLVKEKIPDLNSGLRAIKKEILLKYLYLIPDGFSCVTTMTLVFLCNKYKIKYVPIDYYKRIGKSKFRIFVDTRIFLFRIIKIILYFNPLIIFMPLSLFVLSIGVVKIIYSLFVVKSSLIRASGISIVIFGVCIYAFGLLADLIVTRLNKNNPPLI